MMECNRDEAVRALEIAEKKFKVKDVAGAKKFAIKAQNLYPALEGIQQMVATLDVHLAAEKAVNGERDWYAILDVSASADEESVKKQYRKLALILHPDKNKSVGAEAAFQLVSEAWSVLCDKATRTVYDNKRNVRANQQSSSHTKSKTFWTSCHNCKMQYEYLRVYVNHNLLCPNCHKPFLAIETPNPTNGHNPPVPWTSSQRQQTSKVSKQGLRPKKNTQSVPGSGSTASHSVPGFNSNGRDFQSVDFSRPAGSARGVYPEYGNSISKDEQAHGLKRSSGFVGGFTEGDKFQYYNFERPEKKMRGVGEDGLADYTGKNWEVKDVNAQGSHMFANNIQSANGSYGDIGKSRTTKYGSLKREMAHVDIRGMLVHKGQMLIKNRLLIWASETPDDIAGKKQKGKQKEGVMDDENGTDAKNEDVTNAVKTDKVDKSRKRVHSGKNSSDKSHTGSNGSVQPVNIDVPDPDFHDFDGDRSEKCFEPDQVWATYDDEDGMPRLYALVQKVVSIKPFKIRMSFLTSKNNSELGPLNWVGMGFAKTCGEFRVSRYAEKDSINIFSHKVQWEKGVRGVIKIFPKKGETWALYRNWSADWNEHTDDDVIYKYDMVEVLEDFDEERGVTVTPLVKVAGYKTVFHKHMDLNEIKRIPREEMFRFSHQVPSYFLTGMEGVNAPKGCCELDPAATPLELLQVIVEAKEEEKAEASQVNTL